MLRYKTETRPGLVALYDIRPGNGAGQFLQPRSPHGAVRCMKQNTVKLIKTQNTPFHYLLPPVKVSHSQFCGLHSHINFHSPKLHVMEGILFHLHFQEVLILTHNLPVYPYVLH